MLRRAALALLCLLGLAAPATAQPLEAYFGKAGPCADPATPLEHVLCRDVELLRLDTALKVALVRRALTGGDDMAGADWAALEDAMAQACGLPVAGKAPDQALRWTAARCLVAAFRERLYQLGVWRPAEPSDVRPGDSDAVHPLCLWEIASAARVLGQPMEVALAACNDGYGHVPVRRDGNDVTAPMPVAIGGGEAIVADVHNRSLGRAPNGDEIFIVDEGINLEKIQGQLIVSVARRPTPDRGVRLVVTRMWASGYKCAGMLDWAALDDRGIVVDRKIDDAWSGLPGRLDLPPIGSGCAGCCLGTAQTLHPFDGGPPSLMSVTIPSAEPDDRFKACPLGVLQRVGGQFPRTFSREELRELGDRITEECPSP